MEKFLSRRLIAAIGEEFEDLEQETRISVWKTYGLTEDSSDYESYMKLYKKSLYHRCLSRLRRRNKKWPSLWDAPHARISLSKLAVKDEEEFFSTDPDRVGLKIDLERAFNLLGNEQDARIIQGFLIGGLTVKEVAKMKGISHGKAERWLSEARQVLRDTLR